MIERWRRAGMPLDREVRHPFTDWSQTIGGILKANNFADFLANYRQGTTVNDPARRALGLMGVEHPDQWLRNDEWVAIAAEEGVLFELLPRADHASKKSRERGMGVVLSRHLDETFEFSREENRLVLRLERTRNRSGNGEPATRYRFTTVNDVAST